jgi:hypothetical protein
MDGSRIRRNENAPLWLLLVIISLELYDGFRGVADVGGFDNSDVVFIGGLTLALIVVIAALAGRLCNR